MREGIFGVCLTIYERACVIKVIVYVLSLRLVHIILCDVLSGLDLVAFIRFMCALL